MEEFTEDMMEEFTKEDLEDITVMARELASQLLGEPHDQGNDVGADAGRRARFILEQMMVDCAAPPVYSDEEA